jgi:murein DD-endopeptidase MepM/ murein hydrolase activator NlpD
MGFQNYTAAFTNCLGSVYRHIFHRRNIIIVSERKVKHLPVSGFVQLAVVVVSVSAVCWASYSTGSYFAAHNALKEQSLTLKSVIGNKVDSTFPTLSNDDNYSPLASSKAALSSVDSTQLFARIAMLENKLKESEASKREFIEKVQQKTANNIDSFQTLIKQTGLDVNTMKRQITKTASTPVKAFDRQGGPYVEDSIIESSMQETRIISQLDELSVLKQIVDNLPVKKPLSDYQEMSAYGRRIDPFTGHLALHSGIDLAGPAGSKIFATADGRVAYTGHQGAYGNMVDIDHGFSIVTRYGHLSQILVEDGQQVKKGQVIGIQGATGRATGPHLHYEVRFKDKPMDPRNFINAGRYVQQKS